MQRWLILNPKPGYTRHMGFIIATFVLWIIFSWLTPLKEWRKYYPTLIFTGLLGTIADLLGVVFDQWAYYGPVVGELSLWSDIGIAPAEGALFIRLFPIKLSMSLQIGFWILWALANAVFESLFVWAGLIGYDHWNPFRAWIFYLFFFGLVWFQEWCYNGTGRIKKEKV